MRYANSLASKNFIPRDSNDLQQKDEKDIGGHVDINVDISKMRSLLI